MKRILSVLATLLVGGTMAVAIATPAQAAWSSCLDRNVCFFADSGGGGPLLAYAAPSHTGWIAMPAGWNDVVSSVWNRLTVDVIVCENNPCGSGRQLRIYSGQQVSWVSWAWWNDTVSSWRKT